MITPINSYAMRKVADRRPEIAALLLIVFMFLGFLGFCIHEFVGALDRNTNALNNISELVREALNK